MDSRARPGVQKTLQSFPPWMISIRACARWLQQPRQRGFKHRDKYNTNYTSFLLVSLTKMLNILRVLIYCVTTRLRSIGIAACHNNTKISFPTCLSFWVIAPAICVIYMQEICQSKPSFFDSWKIADCSPTRWWNLWPMLLLARKEWVGAGSFFIVNPLRAQVNNSSKISRKFLYFRTRTHQKLSLNQVYSNYLLTFVPW